MQFRNFPQLSLTADVDYDIHMKPVKDAILYGLNVKVTFFIFVFCCHKLCNRDLRHVRALLHGFFMWSSLTSTMKMDHTGQFFAAAAKNFLSRWYLELIICLGKSQFFAIFRNFSQFSQFFAIFSQFFQFFEKTT